MSINKKADVSCKRIGRGVLVTLGVLASAVSAAPGGNENWTSAGFNAQNTRHNLTESTLGITNIGQLVPKWRLPTQGDVSATPAVEGTSVYVPDFAGNLYAVDRNSGAVRWKVNIADLTGIPGNHARATPAISGNLLILGDQAGKAFSPDGWLLAIDKKSGALVWKTRIAAGSRSSRSRLSFTGALRTSELPPTRRRWFDLGFR